MKVVENPLFCGLLQHETFKLWISVGNVWIKDMSIRFSALLVHILSPIVK